MPPDPNDFFDPFSRFTGAFVRPNADDSPTRSLEASIGVRVSRAVRFDLFAPKLRVALRPRGVFRTTVPEAAIDEDGYPGAGKNDVGDPTRLAQQ
jgi:hypothetical protein